MQKLKFTKEKPILDGFYWVTTDGTDSQTVEVFTDSYGKGVWADGNYCKLSDFEDYFWAGPIYPPTLD